MSPGEEQPGQAETTAGRGGGKRGGGKHNSKANRDATPAAEASGAVEDVRAGTSQQGSVLLVALRDVVSALHDATGLPAP